MLSPIDARQYAEATATLPAFNTDPSFPMSSESFAMTLVQHEGRASPPTEIYHGQHALSTNTQMKKHLKVEDESR
jgi:hypothetical protein